MLFSPAAKPGLTDLISFHGQRRIINISAEIGMQYHVVGTILLNDSTGVILPQIVAEYMNNTEAINLEVLRRWIQGRGMKDRTWSGLLHVLKENGCAALAEEIETALHK